MSRYFKSYYIWAFLLLITGQLLLVQDLGAHNGAGNKHIQRINTNHRLYQICKADVEGYAEKLSGGEFSYPSLRKDHNQALIARATSGKNGFTFLTGRVPTDHLGKEVTFMFYSDMDLNQREPFDVSVNGQTLLTFSANADGSLKILDNPGGGKISYILVERDLNGDGLGIARLSVPKSLVPNGTQAKVSIYGHHKNSNSWFMLFKVTDALPHLATAVQEEAAFSVRAHNDELLVDAPAHYAGESIYLISDGKASKSIKLNAQGELSKANFQLAVPKRSFAIHFREEVFQVDISKAGTRLNEVSILGDFVYHIHEHSQQDWAADFSKSYEPNHYRAFTNFFDKKYADGKVSIMNSSHQDIAWVDRPEICIIMRDTLLLTPVLQDAVRRSDYGFDVEDALILREYLARHPDAKDTVTELLNRQLLSIGATYNCPYEEMYSGEDLVRQLYLGKKWLKKTFDGYDSKVYWNVDVPGKTMQMPQILKKAGVDYMVISRHAKGFFHWGSPDGSTVFTYSPGHYGDDLLQLSKDLNTKMTYGAEQVLWWSQFSQDKDHYTPLLSSQDMLPAIDYSDYINAWNDKEVVKESKETAHKVYLPNMELMTIDEFMPLAEKNVDQVDTIVGERPNVWVYIHGPTHHTAITASRDASKLLTAAEKFSTFAYFLDKTRMPYPMDAFNQAWEDKVYPDHGWGGHDGDITDGLFESKFVSAKHQGEQLLSRALQFLAGNVDTKEGQGIPVLLFNSLSWDRTDPVLVPVRLPQGHSNNLFMVNAEGKELPIQMTDLVRYSDGSIEKVNINFIAENVPALGYQTYYLKTGEQKAPKQTLKATADAYENAFYRLQFSAGGLSQVYDKQLQKPLFKEDNFKVGDVFTMESVGNGAGEFGDIQQPAMRGFDQFSLHNPVVTQMVDGPVFTTYRIEQEIAHSIVQQDVTIYHQLKRIQFDHRLINWDGTLYREFRTAYPINMENATITHEVPFGAVQVGRDEIPAAGERYTPLCKDVHPRAIMDWISASDEEMTITLSSSVAAVDWIDPTKENENSVLQHLLLASRKSCHWEGNLYSQEGSHTFSHVLTSDAVGAERGSRIAEQFNEPMMVVVNPLKAAKASLPTQLSFFETNGGDVMVSAIKKAEDSEDIVLRIYNRSDQQTKVQLNSFFEHQGIYQTNIIEEDPIQVDAATLSKYAIETYLFKMRKE